MSGSNWGSSSVERERGKCSRVLSETRPEGPAPMIRERRVGIGATRSCRRSGRRVGRRATCTTGDALLVASTPTATAAFCTNFSSPGLYVQAALLPFLCSSQLTRCYWVLTRHSSSLLFHFFPPLSPSYVSPVPLQRFAYSKCTTNATICTPTGAQPSSTSLTTLLPTRERMRTSRQR